jgi:hypothetical protein
MTDDRTDDLDGTLTASGAFDWDAALHNAFTDLMFTADQTTISGAGTPADTVHAAFEALMFAAAASGTRAGGAVTAWVANDDGAPEGFGRIMFRREVEANASQHLPGILDATSPQINANTIIASGRAANDNAIWIGSGDSDHLAGVYGRDPSVAVLGNGDALIAWIGADDIVHAQFLAADQHASGSGVSAERAKLDQMLVGLGDAAAALGGKAGRVSVTTVSQNSFAAVWTNDFALQSVLMGTILTLGTAARADDQDATAATLAWSATDITPVAAPLGVNAIAVAVTDAGALTVTYSTEGGSQSDASLSSVIHFDADATVETVNFVNDDGAAAHLAGAASQASAHHAPADFGSAAHGANAAGNDGHAASADGHHSATGNSDATLHLEPSTAVASDGTTYTGHFGEPAEPGGNPPYIIDITGPGGKPAGVPPIILSGPNGPIAFDSNHPALDVTPDLAATDDGPVVTYVAKSGTGAATVTSVQVEAFTHEGKPVGGGPVTVATAHGAQHSFSDVATGYTHRDSAPAAHTDTATANTGGSTVATVTDAAAPASADSGGIVAVAFIADANAEGFGTLKGQLFSIPGDAGPADHLTALGADGEAGGDNDAVFQMATGDDGGCRAPVIEGLTHGSLAIAWVQQTDHGDGPDVVRGEILTPGDGALPEDIDLSEFMPQGVAAGSDPVLTSDEAGDLIIGWIQAVLSGGFESAAAIYRRVNDSDDHGHGHWQAPSQATILNTFDDMPRDFAISVSGSGDTLSLTVAWREADNSISTAHYDIDASQLSQSGTDLDDTDQANTDQANTDLAHNSGHGDDHDGGGLDLAALAAGQMLVVVGSSSDDGTSITTTVLQIPQTDNSSDAGTGVGNGTGTGIVSPVETPAAESAPAPVVLTTSDSGQGGSSGHGGENDNSGKGSNSGGDSSISDSSISDSSGRESNDHDDAIVAAATAPVELAKSPLGSLMAALAQLATDSGNGSGNGFAAMFHDNTAESGGKDNSGHGGGDSGGQNSGSSDNSGHDATATPAPAAVQDAPSVSLASAIINLNSDLIQFVVHGGDADNSASVAFNESADSDAGSMDSDFAPTAHDVAALEAFATPDFGKDGANKDTKSGSSDKSDHSGSGNTGNDLSLNDLSSNLDTRDSGGGHDGRHDDDLDGHDRSGGPNNDNDNDNDNDNARDGHHGSALTFAAGYGNDISDYISPEDQAALIPEPISVLFEALQFANAFNDAANSDVMHFDTSNIVTISQFNSSGHGGGHSDGNLFG